MNEREIEEAQLSCELIIDRVSDAFVGNRLMLRKLLAAALANGHILFEDYPGLGKTLLAKVFAKAIGSDTKRVQFTPDLLPSDILGMNVWRQNDGTFQMVRGRCSPTFCLLTRLTGRPQRLNPLFLRPWKSAR